MNLSVYLDSALRVALSLSSDDDLLLLQCLDTTTKRIEGVSCKTKLSW